MEKYIGLMSGTSMDGVDAVLVEINNNNIQLLGSHPFAMGNNLKQSLLDICLGQPTNLQTLGELDHRLGHLFADAVLALLKKTNTQAADVTAIGSHGQTVFHSPHTEYAFTMQIGDANIIAAKTGITTIADFRRKDMAFGGQGAPLVPAFHQQLFSSTQCTRVILNIGGIANITVLEPNKAVTGFDTGPGNMLMDAWINLHQQKNYDEDGNWARSGSISTPLLTLLLSEPYLEQPAPKSTGRELFNLTWLQQYLTDPAIEKLQLSACDIQATLTEYTAQTIANEVKKTGLTATVNPNELLVCGGGAHNSILMQRLTELLPNWCVMTTADRGVDIDNMEAMAFAWLAYRTMHHQSGNLPEVTGARRLAQLGAIYPAD
ncbi:anhydro-N-acetylmuramic acid kinase [Photobacterium kishitanii]|uniref:Anhydro-N-acetylmuramic acid kinase n=1 Tax=Photobacterium kishitanii TaxID=318456 RepID=A0A0B7JDK4_9GAMM|nr:anhydro-N-acetylmuramic acid kinase [Photobacterium kishitanii]OBU29048.1 anhydro-N-acetylmuramic acid kinase [Photobacterium kishitanii]PSU96850.1 anhydro-N-acetylmuramic acid kinase [Photobacterium kishitanii]PSU96890.1 anhydro-N-acetylmuramic acid kinase [Photobacterium kishitanii]PSV15381.1 anhydro-N-acetylmuramic acid kinase [Photobacterium kishitanii]PSW69372.1 anhydro-N-acetylmuramic acid kinase [Photobacterium kishitanii]